MSHPVSPGRPRRNGHARGQTLVEFAFVAPFFFLILFSIIEFGRAVYYMQTLNNAAREGARYAIVNGNDSFCPSGPMPLGILNPCDQAGAQVVKTVKDYAIAVIDAVPEDFVVSVRWCQPEDGDPATPFCPDVPAGTPNGDGDNGRGQTVDVAVSYTFRPWITKVVPLPTFTINGGSTLVVNH